MHAPGLSDDGQRDRRRAAAGQVEPHWEEDGFTAVGDARPACHSGLSDGLFATHLLGADSKRSPKSESGKQAGSGCRENQSGFSLRDFCAAKWRGSETPPLCALCARPLTGGFNDARLAAYAQSTTFDTVMGSVTFGVNATKPFSGWTELPLRILTI